jgi:exodeoxyribonuclease V beta subunit
MYRVKKPQILEEIAHDNHAIIEASAGTGKTYTIEHMVVDLLLENPQLRIHQILIVTFTERATFELGARIRKLLQAVVDAEASILAGPDEPAWEVGPAERRRLQKALSSFDLAPIHTIHGFCHRVLTENAFQNHRPFEQEHANFDVIFEQVFKDALRREFAHRPEFRAYLAAWLEGKDRAVEKLQDLLSKCVRARGAIRPEFDEDALRRALDGFEGYECGQIADELKAELKSEKVHHSTIRAVISRVETVLGGLEAYRAEGGVAGFLALAGAKDQLDYMSEKLARYDFEGPVGRRIRAAFEAVVPLEAVVVAKFLPVLRRMLREHKEATGQFSYDDMLSLVWESLESRRGPALVNVLRQRYRFALIDEFQDTDDLQWQIFRRIFHESAGANIFYLIGDPKQAIYSFRGADVFTYLHARRAVVDAGGALVRLGKNYRSSPDVIAAYNRLFEQKADAPFFTGEIVYDTPVECGLVEREVRDEKGASAPAVKLVQLVDEELNAARVKEGFAAHFAAEIRALLYGKERLFVRKNAAAQPRPISAADIFVLTRSRSEGRFIAEYLRREGVPYAFFKQDGLFQTAEAVHVYDLLCAIARPRDRSARLKAWLTPFFGLGLEDLARTDALAETDRLLGDLLDWKILADARRFEILFNSILSRTGLLRAEIFEGTSERELTNYLHLFELLLEEAKRDGCHLGELVLRLKAFIEQRREPHGEDGNVQRLETERDAVQIMTMHKSKGLEAEVVFLYGGFSAWPAGSMYAYHDEAGEPVLYLGTPPEAAKARWAREQAEEEQRLMYVALTRAKSQLHLPYIGFENAENAEKPGEGGEEDVVEMTRDYKVDGSYAPILRRLDAVVAEFSNNQNHNDSLFAFDRVEYARTLRVHDVAAQRRALAEWTPPAELPKPLSDAEFAPLRARRPIVTSYSRIKHAGEGWQGGVESGFDEMNADDFRADGGQQIRAIIGPDALPGGKRAGVFLHELVEQVEFERARNHARLADWLGDAEVDAQVRRSMRGFGVDEEYLAFCKKMIWRAVKTPLVSEAPIPVALPCVAESEQTLRELEFIYPIPADAPGNAAGEVQGERGYIKGFVDLLFESGGRFYFADWKSDILADYGPHALDARVAESYGIQATIYILAMVKFLEIADEAAYEQRFGGYFYLFMRGMGAPDAAPSAGVYYRRPTWEDVLSFERTLGESL